MALNGVMQNANNWQDFIRQITH